MHDTTDNRRRRNPVEVYADLRVTCDQGLIDIKACDGTSIFVRFSTWRAASAFLRALKWKDNFAIVLKTVDQALKHLEATLFWRNSRLGILGTNGNPVILWAFIVIQRISKRIP